MARPTFCFRDFLAEAVIPKGNMSKRLWSLKIFFWKRRLAHSHELFAYGYRSGCGSGLIKLTMFTAGQS
jgi:hypothetical protein